MSLVAVEGEALIKRFKTGRTHIEVLKTVDFEARHGEMTMVMGPSGSGKSTLIATLSGLLRPDGGRVSALGQDIWSMKPGKIDRFRLDHCGFIFQGFNLFPALTAVQQVAQVLKFQGMSWKQAKAQATETLCEVGLESRLKYRPALMSGGEKQRVAIARALAKKPQLIFADEPTSALDSENGRQITRMLRAAAEEGATVVCVTHDPRLIEHATRVIRIEDGAMAAE